MWPSKMCTKYKIQIKNQMEKKCNIYIFMLVLCSTIITEQNTIYHGKVHSWADYFIECIFTTPRILHLSSFHAYCSRNNLLIYEFKIVSSLTLNTLMCLSIGTPKIINFPLFSKAKLIIFRCPKIKVHDSLIMMWVTIGTLKNH